MNNPGIIADYLGGLVAVGPDADVRPALNGKKGLILAGRFAGEVVYLAPKETATWYDDALSIESEAIAAEKDHPKYGRVIAAYIDLERGEEAPRLFEWFDKEVRQAIADYMTREKRARDMVPRCGSCGDCPEC